MNKIDLFRNFEIDLPFKITEDIYVSFQHCSGDYNPLHTDKEYASSKGFPDVVMYGNILNAHISYVIGMKLPTRDVMLQLQDIQYKNPVYLNELLHMHLKVVDIEEEWNIVILKYEYTNDDGKVKAKGKIQIGII